MIIIHVFNEGIKHILLDMIIHFEQQGQDSIFLVPDGVSIIGAVGTVDSLIAHELVEVREVVGPVHGHVMEIIAKHHFREVEMFSILHILHILHFCVVWHEPFVHHLHFQIEMLVVDGVL